MKRAERRSERRLALREKRRRARPLWAVSETSLTGRDQVEIKERREEPRGISGGRFFAPIQRMMS